MPRKTKIHFRSANSFRFLISPYSLAALTIGMAVIGTALLLLPMSSTSPTALNTALFSAISAVTTTGLTVVDTGEHWTGFGQAVMLTLAFLGGLGFMTGIAFLLLLTRQKLGLQGRLALSSDIGYDNPGTVARSVRNIVLTAVGIQIVAWILILVDFAFIGGLWSGATTVDIFWQSLFQAVSTFNNAGLEIVPSAVSANSISGFATNYLTIGVSAIAIILGGLSFPVIFDVVSKRRFGRLTLDSKLVLVGTGVLLLVGFAIVLGFEWSNPATLGDRPAAARFFGAFFESVTPRSAGFTTIDQTAASPVTAFTMMVLMLIGGAAATTAGGIKINALMVSLVTFWSTFGRYRNASAFKRTVPNEIAERAFMVIIFVVVLFAVVTALLLVLQPIDAARGVSAGDIVFEGMSAVATVGLSRGITGDLTMGAQIVVMAAMLLGRFGPITVALTHFRRRSTPPFKYPDERVRIG